MLIPALAWNLTPSTPPPAPIVASGPRTFTKGGVWTIEKRGHFFVMTSPYGTSQATNPDMLLLAAKNAGAAKIEFEG
jgi:hypothetical protein